MVETPRNNVASYIRELVHPDRVHRSLYTDQGIFDEEMERIFCGGWVYIAHESEVAEPGDYKTGRIGRHSVIVSRDAEREIHVLLNRCRHRGATVCQYDRGNAKFFRCEYHGWTYQNDGTLTGVPYPQGYETHPKERGLNLLRIARVESYRGFVFASMNPDVMPIEDYLAGAREYVDLFVEQCLGKDLVAKHGFQEIGIAANWKLQMENGADGYHANFTHRSFMQIMQQRTGSRPTYLEGNAPAVSKSLGNGHVVLDQRTSRGSHYVDRVRLSPGADATISELEQSLAPDDLAFLLETTAGSGFNLTIFPNLQLIGTHIREIVPENVTSTTVRYTPLSPVGLPDGVTALRLRAHEFFYSPAGFGSPDDMEIFRRVREGLESFDEWIRFDRGIERETTEGAIRVGHLTDETPQRGEYRQYLAMMDGQPSEATIEQDPR